jgi:hypothetical protein
MKNIGTATRDAVLGTDIAKSVASKELSFSAYAQYMADVYCYAQHSSQVIAAAGSRMVLSHPQLADYMFEHSREELGHDQWAMQDLLDLGLSSSRIEKLVPSEPCQRMIAIEYYFAHHANPVGLFGWMLALEGLGGAIGGSIASGVDECLGLGGKGTYFLRGHGHADSHHSADLIAVTAKHIKSHEEQALVTRVGRLSQSCYVGILENSVSNPIELDA